MRKINKNNFYCLDMFPYPSGYGLHVGHPRGYTATDVYSRYKRLQGYNVLHPMGWDAFGLPAENYAIKHKIHPETVVDNNINKFKKQLENFNFEYNWDREINTTDPEYYKWTQWIFLKMFERGLAYESDAPINFCPSCKTGLANEEVLGGKCERCGTEIVRKRIRQWILKITAYADKLLEDLDTLDWPEPIKEMQRNWIGRSEGSDIEFRIKNTELNIKVFTTRTDTLFGCTYVVLAPEHKLIQNLESRIKNLDEVKKYIESSGKKSDLERTELTKEKTGVELKGIKAVNPINDNEVSIWVADYVLAHYGTGAVMAVPAHDERDFEFAKKYGIEIPFVIFPKNDKNIDRSKAFTNYGVLKNSAEFDGLSSEDAKKKITEKLKLKNHGDFSVNYKLRDWVFSRQRYWGEPIPILHCKNCGIVPIPEKDLPVLLPHVDKYEPTGDSTSPLSNENELEIKKWLYAKCPKCKGIAKRETNTMPQWAGSCWYYIAYLIKSRDKYIWDRKKIDPWLPINLYVGGAEHAVLHLLYARFWHKFLYDEGLVGSKEPFLKLINVGTILGVDGRKMSKSFGNTINPDPLIEKYGPDALRMYELYIGPFVQSAKWNQNGIVGMYRFLSRVKTVFSRIAKYGAKGGSNPDKGRKIMLNKTIKKVTNDIENFDFNTAISSIIECFDYNKDLPPKPSDHEKGKRWSYSEDISRLLIILYPFAPKTTNKIWAQLFNGSKIEDQNWPITDQKYLIEEKIEIPIQINGKVRDKLIVTPGISEGEVKKLAFDTAKIKKWLASKQPKKIIYIKDKILSIVI